MSIIASVLRGAEDRQERADIIDGFDRSMTAQAPLGAVSAEDQREFLAQWPEEERTRALELERDFVHRYSAALREAAARVR